MSQIPIVIYFEASGLGKQSYPIEVGVSQRQGEGWCRLICPEDDWRYWDVSTEKQHRIARDTLLARGETASAIADQLNDLIAGQTVYTERWCYDYVWMTRLFEAAGRTPRFRLADFREIITPQQEVIWHFTKQQVKRELNAGRHRASIVAKILQQTWLKTQDNAAYFE